MQTINWKWFSYQDIFDIRKWKRLTKADMMEWEYPFIWATETSNGVTGQVWNDEYLHPWNVITVSYNGSIGNAFYQDRDFWASDDINVLYPKFPLTKLIATFLITLIEKEKYRYSYWNKWDSKTMKTSKIKLPILQNGLPDWNWIETYVKNALIPQLSETAQEVFSENFRPHPFSTKKITLDVEKWKWFRYDEAFIIEKWYYNRKPEQIENGEIIFIGATESNNGITSLHSEEDVEAIFDANCITVSNDGSIWNAFYQDQKFICSHSINILRPKKWNWNKYSALFVSTLIEKEKYRWAYGRKWRPARMPDSIIKLPITSTGEPDWQFMEDYIKSLPYSESL